MRRIVLAAVSCSLLAVSLVPITAPEARAATRTVVVHGFKYPSGLVLEDHICGGPEQDFAPLYRLGGARGSHATGLGFDAPGVMAGPQAFIPSPVSLESLVAKTLHLEAPVDGDGIDGYFTVDYYSSGGVRYSGYRSLVTGSGTWLATPNLATTDLDWYQWTGDTQSPTGDFLTLGEFALARGGNGQGAWAGVEFGCDGRDFYIDDLQVVTGSGTTVYDFEGMQSRSYLSTYLDPDDEASWRRGIRRLTLNYGQRYALFADGTVIGDGVVPTGYVDGAATLQRKIYGSSGFTYAGRRTYTQDTFGRFPITGSRQTYYRVSSEPRFFYEASTSSTLLVTVRRRITAYVADTRVRRGRTIHVSGSTAPADAGIAVVLQRRTSSGWRTIRTGRTTTGGKYRLQVSASSVGTWTLRVLVPAARGLLATGSPSLTVRVVRNPPPPDSGQTVQTPTPAPPLAGDPDDDLKARQVGSFARTSGGTSTAVPDLPSAPIVMHGP